MRRMVIVALTLALFLSLSLSVHSKVRLGPKAGVAITSVGGEDFEQLDSKMSVALGAFVQVPVGQNSPFSIRGEVQYIGKGGKIEDGGGTLKLNLNYLEIPVFVKYSIPVEGKVMPNFFAGPVVGFLTSAKQKYEYDGDEEEYDIKDFFKSTEFSLCLGGGVDVVMGASGVLSLDLRYEFGLANIYDVGLGDEEFKNNAIMFNAGWGFDM